MIEKLKLLIKAVVFNNLKIYTDDNGVVTGFMLWDIQPFDSAPIEKLLAKSGLGWSVIKEEAETQAVDPVTRQPMFVNGKPSMLPPKCYIGRTGDTLDDLFSVLDSMETS